MGKLTYPINYKNNNNNINNNRKSCIYDLTGGIGRDSIRLLTAGFKVIMHERNSILKPLLVDGIDRLVKEYPKYANEIYFIPGDVCEHYNHIKSNDTIDTIDTKDTNRIVVPIEIEVDGVEVEYVFDSCWIPDVVYIDPMYNETSCNTSTTTTSTGICTTGSGTGTTSSSANSDMNRDHTRREVKVTTPSKVKKIVGRKSKVKKDTQVLHTLMCNDISNNQLLFNIAMKITRNRVVVKRSLRDVSLNHSIPHESIKGKTHRYDIYFKNRIVKYNNII